MKVKGLFNKYGRERNGKRRNGKSAVVPTTATPEKEKKNQRLGLKSEERRYLTIEGILKVKKKIRKGQNEKTKVWKESIPMKRSAKTDIDA